MTSETPDPEFSQEFADLLAPILRSIGIGHIEVRDQQVVIRVDHEHVVYLDVRAARLGGAVRLRRPVRRRSSVKAGLRLVR